MEHIYDKARPSSEGSRYLESSEEIGFISEQTSIRHKYVNNIAQRLRTISFRAVIESFMGGLIFILLIVLASYHTGLTTSSSTSSSVRKVARFGPSWRLKFDILTVPEKVVKFGNVAGFGPDIVYVDHEMLYNATHKRELHENWQKLYPKSRGYIKSTSKPGDDFEYSNPAYQLDGFLEPDDHYEGYILSVFHQLHCLSILTSRLGTSYEEFGRFTRPQLEHTSHCIEYLRQAILCAGDTSLEGETGAWPASAAWGQKHTCKDYNALIAMADDRGMWDLSNARHPDLSKIHPDPEETKGKYGGD